MSMNQRPSWRSPAALLSAAAVCLAGFSVVHASSRPQTVQAAPTVVGLVDLQTLIEGLDEVKAQNLEVQKRAKELQSQIDATVKAYEEARVAYEAAPPTDPRKFELGVKAQSLKLSAEGNAKGLGAALAFEKGRYWRQLYPRINQALDDLAKQQGLDVILLDDRKLTLPNDKELTDEQITGFLQSKKIMYAKNSVDATGALIDLMNNSFKTKPR